MSYQRVITPRSVVWSEHLAPDSLHFAACSRHLMRHQDGKRNWHVVYNGVPRRAYEPCFAVRPDAPLVFLGRIEEIKGTHIAIEVARRAGRDLIIAGNVSDEWRHRHYFETRVAPYLDGIRVRYVGPVNDRQKAQLLGGAAALLMPVLWDEPFGIVMAEALACGTPVIGFGRGAVPEVVVHGLTGFVCQSVEEMVDAVQRIRTLGRVACRHDMEERFSDRSVVSGYLRVYGLMLQGTRALQS